jgi:LCP family protein required for cell wall assembly
MADDSRYGHDGLHASRYPGAWRPREPTQRRRSGAALLRSATLASFLSFLLPGLGQLVIGARRRGLLIAAPALALLAVAATIWIADRGVFIRAVLTPPVLLGLVALDLVLLGYRSWAIVDAYLTGRRRRGGPKPGWVGRSAAAVVLVALIVVTGYTHGWLAYVGWSAYETLTAVVSPTGPSSLEPGGAAALPSASSPPTTTPPTTRPMVDSRPTPTPTPTPPPPEWAEDGRLNVLLIGSDAGPGRWSMRADAIILVTVEIETGRVAAFSVPRYTRGVPLPEPAASAFECRCLMDDYFNALYVYANDHPQLFPGGDIRGLLALNGAAEELFGVHLDGMAMVDLNGFVRLVDAIGGITVDVPEPVYDAELPDPKSTRLLKIYFKAGEQRMDGWHALAYARTRHQGGDVARMARQQLVIQALRRELSCDLLLNLPTLLDVARETLWTNLPLEDVPEMLRIDPGPVESHVLFDTYNVTLTPDDVARIQAEVAGAFDGPPPPDDAPELDC